MSEYPTPMAFCKASMIDAHLQGNTYLVKIYSELIDELNKLAALREAARRYRAACATPNVSYSSRAIAWAEVDELLGEG